MFVSCFFCFFWWWATQQTLFCWFVDLWLVTFVHFFVVVFSGVGHANQNTTCGADIVMDCDCIPPINSSVLCIAKKKTLTHWDWPLITNQLVFTEPFWLGDSVMIVCGEHYTIAAFTLILVEGEINQNNDLSAVQLTIWYFCLISSSGSVFIWGIMFSWT